MIAHSAFEYASDLGGVERARAIRDKSPSLDPRTWSQIVDLGWPLIFVAEQHGGSDCGAAAMAALIENTSRVLLPEPLIGAIASAGLLSDCDTDEAREMLRQLVEVKERFVVVDGTGSPHLPLRVTHVPDCYAGARLLVAREDDEGFDIRMLEPGADGVSIRTVECIDGSILSDIDVEVRAWEHALRVGHGGVARRAFEKSCDAGLLGYAASLVGIAGEAFQITVEYMKTRSQFGAKIGSFQALQHRAASCHVDIASTRALLYECCRAFDTPVRTRAVSAAKARASSTGLRVTKECIQFHGAIGFADEHNIGLYFKKAVTLAARQGNEARMRRRFIGRSEASR
jgi:alkylation response protein AidB-like acyl-CoA dehydrogenase